VQRSSRLCGRCLCCLAAADLSLVCNEFYCWSQSRWYEMIKAGKSMQNWCKAMRAACQNRNERAGAIATTGRRVGGEKHCPNPFIGRHRFIKCVTEQHSWRVALSRLRQLLTPAAVAAEVPPPPASCVAGIAR
jgi:hypothetical protein